MPRRLILMRHATAGSATGRDHERPLTARGFDEAQRMGAWLRSEGRAPDRVLASTARRCRETWQAVSSGLAGATPSAAAIAFDDQLYDASMETLLAAARDAADAEALLLIAHNPGISLLALELGRDGADDEARLRTGFAPATIAIFDVEGEWADLAPNAARLERLERAR